jgi:dTDP-4-dehydrorhamnose 3,5-epimerase-like enzyme
MKYQEKPESNILIASKVGEVIAVAHELNSGSVDKQLAFQVLWKLGMSLRNLEQIRIPD